MKFSESLKKNKDFQSVYRNGKSFANKCLVMYIIPNELNKNRLGISVSKKVGLNQKFELKQPLTLSRSGRLLFLVQRILLLLTFC